MVWPGQPQSQQERHWTNCQHDLHTSCQQHLGCSVKEWWVTDVLGNATICPFLKYIPSETMHLNGCHRDTFPLEHHNRLSVLMFHVAIPKAKQSEEYKCIQVKWAEMPSESSLNSVTQYEKKMVHDSPQHILEIFCVVNWAQSMYLYQMICSVFKFIKIISIQIQERYVSET